MKRATHEVPASDGKRVKTGASAFGSTPQTAHLIGRITDSHLLKQRQKQVDFGKNTLAYERYVREVPRAQRGRVGQSPWTPDISDPCGKRAFDGRIKQWRRDLHEWASDNPEKKPETAARTADQADATGLSGLSGCATSFDDFLDGHLGGDDEADTQAAALLAQPAQPAPAVVPPAAPPAAEPPVDAAAPAPASSSMRQRLDQFKTTKAPNASIFSAFNDDGLM